MLERYPSLIINIFLYTLNDHIKKCHIKISFKIIYDELSTSPECLNLYIMLCELVC